MARPLCIEHPGALHHVMSRGNERRPVVRDDADRLRRVDWLRRTVETYGWRLHAFVLMNNHEHLFVETPRPDLSAGMQFLNGSYTSYFNLRHRRHGHLFQGRFKAQLIEKVGHYTEISRYIHLNPVRAGMETRRRRCLRVCVIARRWTEWLRRRRPSSAGTSLRGAPAGESTTLAVRRPPGWPGLGLAIRRLRWHESWATQVRAV